VAFSPSFAVELSITHQLDNRAQIVVVELTSLPQNVSDDERHHVVEQLILATGGMTGHNFQLFTNHL